jgi:hypothetical protein
LLQATELASTSFGPNSLLLLVAPQNFIQITGHDLSKLFVTGVVSAAAIHGLSPAMILEIL